jgi:threonine aldolase
MPSAAVARLREVADFKDWNLTTGEVRWMCSYATTPDAVRGFGYAIAHAVGWR